MANDFDGKTRDQLVELAKDRQNVFPPPEVNLQTSGLKKWTNTEKPSRRDAVLDNAVIDEAIHKVGKSVLKNSSGHLTEDLIPDNNTRNLGEDNAIRKWANVHAHNLHGTLSVGYLSGKVKETNGGTGKSSLADVRVGYADSADSANCLGGVAASNYVRSDVENTFNFEQFFNEGLTLNDAPGYAPTLTINDGWLDLPRTQIDLSDTSTGIYKILKDGTSIILQVSNSGSVRVENTGSGLRPIVASAFNTSSSTKVKRDITPINSNDLEQALLSLQPIEFKYLEKSDELLLRNSQKRKNSSKTTSRTQDTLIEKSFDAKKHENILKTTCLSQDMSKEEIFDYVENAHYGFSAEEIAKCLPMLVSFDDDGNPSGINMMEMIPILVKIIQRHEREIVELKANMAGCGKQMAL